jgi:DNA ligase 1
MASRTMLAASFDDDELLDLKEALLRRGIYFPIMASPKIDGIRFTVVNGVAQSRSGKALPNVHFQNLWGADSRFEGLDGEVVVGQDPACINTTSGTLFNRTQSAIMSSGGKPDFSVHIFDDTTCANSPFDYRHSSAARKVIGIAMNHVKIVSHAVLDNPDEVLEYEKEALENGYEGIMLRHPHAPYKFGRSTLKQQGLIKIKRFIDDEATVIGFEALERNTNPIARDAFGLAKRSAHKAGKVQDNLLGKLNVRHPKYGVFSVGSGFDVATRELIWNNQDKYLDKLVTFKYQPHGTMDAPRAPIFKGFRDRMDT